MMRHPVISTGATGEELPPGGGFGSTLEFVDDGSVLPTYTTRRTLVLFLPPAQCKP